MAKQLADSHSKSLSISGLSSVTINNTIYLYGDKKLRGYNNIWLISSQDISNNISPTPLSLYANNSNVPNLRYSPGVTLDNSILAFSSNTVNATYMSIYSFAFNNWSLISPDSLKKPLSKKEYSVSLTQENVYLFGGSDQKSANLSSPHDFWVYHTKSKTWDLLVSPFANNNTTRCGHSASILSDGRLIIIGGYSCPSSSVQKTLSTLDLIPMDQVLIFDTITSVWVEPPRIKGSIPPARTYHSAIVINDNGDIFICGGQNEAVSPFQIYLGSQVDHLGDMVAILDTHAWTWRFPKQFNVPYPQSSAVISIINSTKLVYGFGINYHTVYDDFHVFNILTETWEDPAPSSTIFGGILLNKDNGFSPRINDTFMWAIIIGCIGFAIVCSCLGVIWTMGTKRIRIKLTTSLKLIKREIWKPRIGEPGWAETSRLILKLLFLFLFVYLISTLTSQVINSPIIDQLSYEENFEMTVDVPDIKFCFGDWVEKEKPYIRCTTDFGMQCSDYILSLPSDDIDRVCMLFRAPYTFKLGETSERLLSNGSFLIFDYYYNGDLSTLDTTTSQIQLDVYNKFHDPNILIYNLSFKQDSDIPQFEWNDKYEQDLYRYTDSKGRQSLQNSHQVNYGVVNTIAFELIKRVSLNPGVWNYAGVASSVKTKYEIETMSTPESFVTIHDPSSGAPQPLGSIHIVPLSSQIRVLREQKAFAFINAMGIFGGLFGLLFSLQSCLFGYRPRSPWGYMHRWSFGHLRSSLMRGLQANFFPNAAVTQGTALVLPVVDKYPTVAEVSAQPVQGIQPLVINTKNLTSYLLPASPVVSFPNSEKDVRMAQIEDRIHMLERLFQAYYINDEIFRSLDNALKNDPSPSMGDTDTEEGGRKRK